MVQHHELAVLPDAKRSGHEGAPAEHPMLPNFTALGAQAPQCAHLPITVNVHVREFRESFASVKFAARDAGRLLVGMSHQRLKDRRGALRTVRAYVLLASLGNAPAVIAALLNAHNALPQFPADFTHQKVSCFCVEGQTPRIPKPIRPDFAARLGQRDKRVVLWNGVQLPRFLAVHINSQNARENIANILPRHKGVRWVGIVRVAGRDVEHPIRPKPHVAPFVSAGKPGEHDHPGLHINSWDCIGCHAEAQDTRAVFNVPLAAPVEGDPHEYQTVLGKIRMQRHRINAADLAVELLQIGHQLDMIHLGTRFERGYPPSLLDHDQATASRQREQIQRPDQRQFRIDALDHIGQRRFGRAMNAGGRPLLPLLGNQVDRGKQTD